MMAIDIGQLRQHIGTRISDEDIATEAPLRAIVATFDRKEDAPREGQPVPPGWHIGYFLSSAPTATLATDGLPTGAGVLPKDSSAATDVCRLALYVSRTNHGGRSPASRDGAQGSPGARRQHRHVDCYHANPPYLYAARPRGERGRRYCIPRRGEAGRQERHPEAGRASGRLAVATDYHSWSCQSFSPLGADRQSASHPLRSAICDGGGGLSRSRRAWTVHPDRPDQLRARQHKGAGDPTFSMRARAPLFDTAPYNLLGRPIQEGAACEVWAVTPNGTIAMQATATLT